MDLSESPKHASGSARPRPTSVIRNLFSGVQDALESRHGGGWICRVHGKRGLWRGADLLSGSPGFSDLPMDPFLARP